MPRKRSPDLQTGDTLDFSNQNGITGSYNSGTGVLTLSGSATPGQYQTALQSVTFSTTSTVIGTRTIDVVAIDSNASVTTSNTAVDTVVEAIAAPVLTAGHAGIGYTAGQSAQVLDSGITVSSADTNLTGATVTISAGTLQTGDTLNFTSPGGSGITGSYNSGTGTLTLSGSASVANYQTALQSVTFVNSTSTSTTNRSIAVVVQDSNDTGHTNSGTVTETVTLSAPVTVTGGLRRRFQLVRFGGDGELRRVSGQPRTGQRHDAIVGLCVADRSQPDSPIYLGSTSIRSAFLQRSGQQHRPRLAGAGRRNRRRGCRRSLGNRIQQRRK